MTRKIVVTGADGFIGSHLVEHLVRRGYGVRAFVLYNSFSSRGWLDHSPVAGDMEFFSGDIRDPGGVRNALKGCDAVLHLASLISIPYSYHSPETFVDTNVKGTLNVLQAVRDLGLSRMVHTSTSEVYGTARYVPMDEEHPLSAQSPYAASKIGADQLASSFHRSFDTPVTTLRPFNTYGPRQSIRAVIPATIVQVLAGRREIRLGNLAPTRDFNFVDDTVRAFTAALETDGLEGMTLNAGSGFEVSIGDTVRLIAEAAGAEVSVVREESRLRPGASEVERLLAGSDRLRSLTGWRPEYAGIEGFRRGLARTVAWFSDPENRRRYPGDDYAI